MANPIPEKGLVADKSGKPLLSDRQAFVADPPAITATAIAAAIPAAAPAGGTGAAAGAWDTAANRDAAITTINDLRAHAVEMDLDYEALLADVTSIRAKLVAVLDVLEAHGLMAAA